MSATVTLQVRNPDGTSPEAMRQLLVAGASRPRPSSGHLAPSLLDDYTITRELDRGGCGAVYLATPKAGGDPVAVKLMLSRAQADTRAVEQFKREMQVIAKLQHPNIVRLLDSGSDEGTFFFVMEFCDGGSLAPIRRVDIPVRQANAMQKNRAKLPIFFPPLAMVDNKVHPPSRPQRHEHHRPLRSTLSFSSFQPFSFYPTPSPSPTCAPFSRQAA